LVTKGKCLLYLYSRSFQIQPECRKEFDTKAQPEKNNYFTGCNRRGKKDQFKSCVPQGGSRSCSVLGKGLNPGLTAIGFPCCIQVHHHIEKLPCENPESHLTTPTDTVAKDSATLLKLGGQKGTGIEATTVFVSSAIKGNIPQGYYDAFKKPFMGKKDNRLLFLDNKTWHEHGRSNIGEVYHRGWTPPYWDHLSPRMGVAVDQNSIFILGGMPLALKQYKRESPHKSEKTLLDRLCVPACEVNPKEGEVWQNCGGAKIGAKVGKPGINWFGKPAVEVQTGDGKKWGHNGVEPSLSKMERLQNRINKKAPNGVWDTMANEVTGGALALDLDSEGVARKVYGITHCGTLFMVDLKDRRAVILLHMGAMGKGEPGDGTSGSRWEVGIALQKYMTPEGEVSNLFVSVSKKAFSQNFRSKNYVPSAPGKSLVYKVNVNAIINCYRGCETAKSTNCDHGGNVGLGYFDIYWSALCKKLQGATKEQAIAFCRKIGKTGINGKELFGWHGKCEEAWDRRAKARKNPKDEGRLAHIVNGICVLPLPETWYGTTNQNRRGKAGIHDRCPKAVSLLGDSWGMDTGMHYHKGSLMWYGGEGLQLKKWSLDIGIPCGGLVKAFMGQLRDWCLSKDGICSQSYPGKLLLNEAGMKQPWDVKVYRKSTKNVIKTSICARPSQPTTRHSPQRCCVQKEPRPGQTPTEADLVLG